MPLSVDSEERESNADVAGHGIEEGVGRVLLAVERAVDAVARCGGYVTEMIKGGVVEITKKEVWQLEI